MATLLRLLVLAVLWADVSSAPSDCKSFEERTRNPGKGSGSPSVASADRKVVCSNMELQQVLPPDSFPNRTVNL